MAYTVLNGRLVKVRHEWAGMRNGKGVNATVSNIARIAASNHASAKQAEPDKRGSTPTLDRLAAFVAKRRRVQGSSMGLSARHEAMHELADEARSLGLKGRFNLLCNRTQCLAEGANWYNRGSHAFYCEDCASMLNHENHAYTVMRGEEPLCRPVESAEEAARLHVSQ